MPTYEEMGFGGGATLTRDRSHTLFGQTMGLVTITLAFAALGAFIGKNMAPNAGFILFIGALGCVFGLNIASAKGNEQLAMVLLFALGLLLGLAIAPIIADITKTQPDAVYQAAAATAGFVGILGAGGYATRKDLSSWVRLLFWALVALIVFGLISIFVAIPNANIIYCVAGLVIFGGFTIVDFNRLRHRKTTLSPVVLAAGIFLDIFNIFLFFLQIFGGGRR